MLLGIELLQCHDVLDLDVGQHFIFAALALLGHDLGITIKLENAALGTQLEIAGRHRDQCRQVLRRHHLAGQELTPDQLIEPLSVFLHTLEVTGLHFDI